MANYENLLMNFFSAENFIRKNFFEKLIFVQKIDCGYTLEPPWRGLPTTSTHNLCFGSKIRKINIPMYTPVLLYNNDVQGGINFTNLFPYVYYQHFECILSLVKSNYPRFLSLS